MEWTKFNCGEYRAVADLVAYAEDYRDLGTLHALKR